MGNLKMAENCATPAATAARPFRKSLLGSQALVRAATTRVEWHLVGGQGHVDPEEAVLTKPHITILAKTRGRGGPGREKAVKALLLSFMGSFHILNISYDTNRKGEDDRSLGQKPDSQPRPIPPTTPPSTYVG